MSSSFMASGVISWLLMGFGVSVLYSSRGMIGYEDVAHTVVLSLFASSYFGRFSFFAILWIYECLMVPLAILLHLLGIRRSDLARYGRIMAEMRTARRMVLVYVLASALFALSIFLGKNLAMGFIAVLLLLPFAPRVHYGEMVALPKVSLNAAVLSSLSCSITKNTRNSAESDREKSIMQSPIARPIMQAHLTAIIQSCVSSDLATTMVNLPSWIRSFSPPKEVEYWHGNAKL